jgi:hypothetical protein
MGDASTKMRQTNKNTLAKFGVVRNSGFTIAKKTPKLIQIPPTSFHSDAGKQSLIANDRNRIRWVVLGLSRDGACINLFENHRENSLKGNLSKDTTVIPPLLSLTFKKSLTLNE